MGWLQRYRTSAAYSLMLGKSAAKLAKEEARSVVQFKRAARDALYIIIDFWKTMKRAHKEYGAFQLYITQAAKGKINHEDFRGVDMTLLKRMLDDYRQVRGPLTGFDVRWFYWAYGVVFLNILYSLYILYSLQDQRKQVQSSMTERREMFDKDYIED